MKKSFKVLLTVILLLAASYPVLAQEDELEVGPQNILPGHPLYFLKNIRRRVQKTLTFNPVKKLELRERFSSERLAELEELTKRDKPEKVLNRAAKAYEKESESVRRKAQALRERGVSDERIRSFLDKYTRQQEVHSRVLERIRERVPADVADRIEEQRQRHLERFKNVMLELEEEGVPERLQNLKDPALREEIKRRMPERVRRKAEEAEVCIQLWEPVCGSDGRTYSNRCFAGVAGVEIEHEGRCRVDLEDVNRGPGRRRTKTEGTGPEEGTESTPGARLRRAVPEKIRRRLRNSY